jgi:hypothetical protein
MAPVDLQLTRVDASTLDLSSVTGSFLCSEWERLFRAAAQPLPAGTVLPLDGLTIEVRQATEGRPTVVRFRFDASLEDPSLRFLEWRGRRLVPVVLPAIGQTRPVFRSRPLLATPAEPEDRH